MKDALKIKQPKSLTEMVANRLRQAIVDGEFALGENVSEEKLAEVFGVSRTPVRDALTQLQLMGLVTVRPKRGSFVFEPSEADVIAICEFRYMLEANAVRLALQRDAKTFLASLSGIVAEMESAQAAGDAVAYSRADTRFHQSFFDHCGNSYVQDSFRLVEGRIATLRTILTAPIKALRKESLDEHRHMVTLMEQGDLPALERIFRTHIDRTLAVHLEALRTGVIGNADRTKTTITSGDTAWLTHPA